MRADADLPEPEPSRASAPASVDLAGFGAVILTSVSARLRRLGQFPVFDEMGFPVVLDDLTTAAPGLYFCGVHFLRTRKSSLLFGVGDD